jgi:Flp pilus assembly pilin Flp
MMARCLQMVRTFLHRESGLTTAQYAMFSALIMAILVTAASLMGKGASRTFTTPLPASTTQATGKPNAG